jgi:hypothetical protein
MTYFFVRPEMVYIYIYICIYIYTVYTHTHTHTHTRVLDVFIFKRICCLEHYVSVFTILIY